MSFIRILVVFALAVVGGYAVLHFFRTLFITVFALTVGVAYAGTQAEPDALPAAQGWSQSAPKGKTPAAPVDASRPAAAEAVPAVRTLDKVDVERERLAELSQELVYLRRLVADAARQAPGATRIQFRYDWLDRDLELIQRGIQEHFDAPRQPRPAPALKGNYRR